MNAPDPTTWRPDTATLSWACGVIDDDHVRTTLIRTHQRLHDDTGIDTATDDYWQAMAEAAVEAAVWSIADRARDWPEPDADQA